MTLPTTHDGFLGAIAHAVAARVHASFNAQATRSTRTPAARPRTTQGAIDAIVARVRAA